MTAGKIEKLAGIPSQSAKLKNLRAFCHKPPLSGGEYNPRTPHQIQLTSASNVKMKSYENSSSIPSQALIEKSSGIPSQSLIGKSSSIPSQGLNEKLVEHSLTKTTITTVMTLRRRPGFTYLDLSTWA